MVDRVPLRWPSAKDPARPEHSFQTRSKSKSGASFGSHARLVALSRYLPCISRCKCGQRSLLVLLLAVGCQRTVRSSLSFLRRPFVRCCSCVRILFTPACRYLLLQWLCFIDWLLHALLWPLPFHSGGRMPCPHSRRPSLLPPCLQR